MPQRQAEHIVALGASAGGLEPLIAFLRACVPGHGLGYIVVQHLAPGHPSALPALLQQHTTMPVYTARDGSTLMADTVAVIGPAMRLTLADGHLRAVSIGTGHAATLLIDDLLQSLAVALGPAAVGVVLSGMGADGTEGLRAILEQGGLGLVQRLDNAQFDSMPRHALAIGRGVVELLPADMPQHILQQLRLDTAPVVVAAPLPLDATDPANLAALLLAVTQTTGHDFSQYKMSTLRRRVERRMALHASASMADYRRLLLDNPQEAALLFKELLIGVTGFFRDATVWQALQAQVLPGLLAQAAARPVPQFRAWVAGCSTGEEAYTLAMLVLETIAATPALRGLPVQIFATDLSADAIMVARRGSYSAAAVEPISAERLARFFVPTDSGWRVSKPLRDSVLFAHHDLVNAAPFTRLDLLSCRNLLIYFKAELQRRLLPLMHYVLLPGGVLVLGNAETPGRFESLLAPLDSNLRLFRRVDGPGVNVHLHLPFRRAAMTPSAPDLPPTAADGSPPVPVPVPLQALADRLMLDEFSPPAVLANPEGDILYISGRTGRYLEPAAGKANWNLHAMVRDGLGVGLGTLLRRLQPGGPELRLDGLVVNSGTGQILVDLLARPVALPGQGPLVLVVFLEQRQAPPPVRQRRAGRGAQDDALHSAREEVQALREEMRSSQEELQSANEELQSTNEELQSTNEELTTSKEEMQAMNEELQTVNAELVAKLEDLALAQSDLKNLLNSTQIATLFLDGNMNVRRFTEQARQVINLRDGDVGRPLTDLTMALDYPALPADITRVLDTLTASEKAVQTNDDRWFSVRVMPYRTQDNVIDGSVITFVDITAAKEMEARLQLAGGTPPR